MRTYEETVDNILKKKEKYDEKRKKRGKILSVAALVAVFAIVFTAVPLSIFIIARNAADPAETAKETAADTEVSLIEETAAPYPVKPGGEPEETGLPATKLNYTDDDKKNGTFILSGSKSTGDLSLATPIRGDITHSLTYGSLQEYGVKKLTVRAETDGGIELVSEPTAVYEDFSTDTVFEFSYRYKDGGSEGRVLISCEFEVVLNPLNDNEKTVISKTGRAGIAAKIKGYDFFSFYNAEGDLRRTLYRDAAVYFGDVVTPVLDSNDARYTAQMPKYMLDPYMPDYYDCITCKELRMLFEAEPSYITPDEAGLPEDDDTIFVYGTVGSSEGSYLANTPGSLDGKQVIAYDKNKNILGITLTNESGGFFIKVDISELEKGDRGFVKIGVSVEEGHDFLNGRYGEIYVSWFGGVRGKTSVDMGYCDRATAKAPQNVMYIRNEPWIAGERTLGRMGGGSLYIDTADVTEEGTVYKAFNIFSVLPMNVIGTKQRAEITVSGDVKLLSDAEYEREITGQWPETDHDFSFILPDGGSGTVLIYNYEKTDGGAEKPGESIVMIRLISAGGLLHIYREYVHTAAGEASVKSAITRYEGLAAETASEDYAAQIVMMYAEAYRLKHSSGSLDEYHSERLAEIENRLLSYGVAAPEIPSA